MANILIAGGSGLIGKRLTLRLKKEGHRVSWLSRSASRSEDVQSYRWNPATLEADPAAFADAEVVIVLSGSNVAGQSWTTDYKNEIINSRLASANTVLYALENFPNKVHTLLAASAIGYYGHQGDLQLIESSPGGKGFLPETTRRWEDAYKASSVRTVNIRIGIVLSTHGGALPQMAMPLKFGVCPVLGNGQQYMSWIHLDDLCGIFIHAMHQTGLSGPVNAVSPQPVTHRQFMETMRKVLAPYAMMVPAPAAIIRIVMGERSSIVLDSTRVSASKILNYGFSFRFPDLQNALQHLYEKKQ